MQDNSRIERTASSALIRDIKASNMRKTSSAVIYDSSIDEIFDTSITDLLEILSGCLVFISYGERADSVEDLVDEANMMLEGDLQFMTISVPDLDEGLNLVRTWRLNVFEQIFLVKV